MRATRSRPTPPARRPGRPSRAASIRPRRAARGRPQARPRDRPARKKIIIFFQARVRSPADGGLGRGSLVCGKRPPADYNWRPMHPVAAPSQKPARLVLHPGWVVFAALALAIPMGALMFRQTTSPELPVLAELPQFSLVAEDGKAFGKGDLLGRVWIADFVFTSCADACP